MVDQSKISSGFDIEFLMGEKYLRYFLLSSLETGTIPLVNEGTDDVGIPTGDVIILHPPEELNEKRLYDLSPGYEGNERRFLDLVPNVYSSKDDEFQVTILAPNPVGADIRLKVYPTIISGFTNVLIPNSLDIWFDLRFSPSFTTRSDGLLEAARKAFVKHQQL